GDAHGRHRGTMDTLWHEVWKGLHPAGTDLPGRRALIQCLLRLGRAAGLAFKAGFEFFDHTSCTAPRPYMGRFFPRATLYVPWIPYASSIKPGIRWAIGMSIRLLRSAWRR